MGWRLAWLGRGKAEGLRGPTSREERRGKERNSTERERGEIRNKNAGWLAGAGMAGKLSLYPGEKLGQVTCCMQLFQKGERLFYYLFSVCCAVLSYGYESASATVQYTVPYVLSINL